MLKNSTVTTNWVVAKWLKTIQTKDALYYRHPFLNHAEVVDNCRSCHFKLMSFNNIVKHGLAFESVTEFA